jgi:hypothetical protein
VYSRRPPPGGDGSHNPASRLLPLHNGLSKSHRHGIVVEDFFLPMHAAKATGETFGNIRVNRDGREKREMSCKSLLVGTSKVAYARVAELADALDLGSSGETRAGSTPVSRIRLKNKDLRRFAASPFLLALHARVTMV